MSLGRKNGLMWRQQQQQPFVTRACINITPYELVQPRRECDRQMLCQMLFRDSILRFSSWTSYGDTSTYIRTLQARTFSLGGGGDYGGMVGISDDNLADRYGKKKTKTKRSALEGRGKRASNHVRKFQIENGKIGSRNPNFVSLIVIS